MNKEELENISSELFEELALEEQQELVGQVTNMSSCTVTGNQPNFDFSCDYMPDFS